MVKLARLFVLAFSIYVPIYILIIFFRFGFELYWLPESWVSSQFLQIIIKWVTPILFCIAWAYFMFKLGTRTANSMELMGKESSFISPHYFLFFGVNTLVLLVIFLIPLITPIVAILSLTSMLFGLLTSRVDYEDLDAPTQKAVKRMTFFGAIPGIFCSILVIPESWTFSIATFNSFWSVAVEPLFYFIKAMGVALSIGAAIIFYRRAVKEVDGFKSERSYPDIYLIEALIIAGFMFMNYNDIPLIEILYYLGPIFTVLIFVANLFRGKQASTDALQENPLGIIVWLVFVLVTFLFNQYEWLRIGLIVGSAFLFLVYFIAFLNHPVHEELEKQ